MFDFRVGGRDIDEKTFHHGPVWRGEATYFDIVEPGVYFEQFWGDGPNHEAGTRGLLHALANHLA
ncbi:hypothetical protein [Aeromicrobium sp.]|uniref:hypothetical protein n=1 Tax=Aeromicrobium sp. TaxID=1871063 RepID=UPI0025C0CBE6|nr:hypothetical protein [Aeromicrobium sp.]